MWLNIERSTVVTVMFEVYMLSSEAGESWQYSDKEVSLCLL